MGSHESKLSSKELSEIVNSTLFTETEIRNWYKSFLRDCPSGTLTLREFKTYCGKCFASSNPDSYAETVFRSFDTNQNGKIDFREFIRTLSIISRGSFDQKLQWAFKVFDIDNDDMISREEVEQLIQAIYDLIGRDSMMKMTSDGLSASERVNKMFEVMDKNRDGWISMEEFVLATKQDPGLIILLLRNDTENESSLATQ